MKIKVKKEVAIVDLLALHYANEIKATTYISNNGGSVTFKPNGLYDMENVSHEDMFEVEYLDEITLDTRIPNLAQVWTMNNKPRITMYHDCTIQEFIDNEKEYPPVEKEGLMLYMVDDSRTMTMIYNGKELVK
ncbi:hypothetical protein [Staphylococcus chromogenes]|uniref:hypothetical protein n=1 Tax=Staphylococcus chromogenes TaxID=46126 RepID=UPI0028880AB3|nr:hypothetical protein [Staphylococcus chromogenes]MDT0700384.1 hypothetical protein [Staphylococcus chromogenes]